MKKITLEDFILKSNQIHKNFYDYSKVNYVNFQTKVEIICPIHGSFFQTPNNHNTKGCSKCKGNKIKETKLEKYGDANFNNNKKTKETNLEKYGSESPLSNKGIIIKSRETKLEKYGDANFNNNKKTKETNLEKYGVDNVSKREDIKELLSIIALSRDKTIIDKATEARTNNFKAELTNYIGSKYELISYNGYYDIKIRNIETNITITTSYYTIKRRKENNKDLTDESQVSYMQNDITEFIRELGFGFDINNRKIITPLELDIFIYSKNIAIEFNGLYWHSEKQKELDYHQTKTNLCESKGIQLIHIYEDDWLYKQDIVKSRLKSLFGLSDRKIFARKCEVKELDSKTSKQFLDENHIQGGQINSKYRYGLYFQDELVACMTFGQSRFEKGKLELHRFANKLNTNVIGGASKLFKHFLRLNIFKEIISYADRSWSQGKLYETLGFKLIGKTKPNYSYVIDNCREQRFKFRKSELVKQGFDSSKTEVEIMNSRGYYRIFDSGSLKFEYKN